MNQPIVNQSVVEKHRESTSTGTRALFLIQIFSTLGFSVLYSTLILYATKGLGMNDLLATSITGSFIALNYFLHLLGGYIGGRYLSYRSLFIFGMGFQILGYLFISVPDPSYLLWGLAFFLAGSGVNLTCINCMVTQLFDPQDKRREAAFLWNYSGMNMGFFIGFSMGGYFHNQQAYHTLFLLSAIGTLIAFFLTVYNWSALKDRDTTLMHLSQPLRKQAMLIGISAMVALALALRGLLEHTTLCNQLILIIGVAMLVVITILAIQQQAKAAQNKMYAYIILALAAVIFWALYQLAPMGFNLFIDRNVDRHFLGFLIAPQWVQNINTIVIIIGGPTMGYIFNLLRQRGFTISIPFQFSIALILIGTAFAILPMGIEMADEKGYTHFSWILVSYSLQSLAELFISPIGYAMIGQLAPLKLRGLMMGAWMMIVGVAALISDYFSKIALGSTLSTDPLVTNAGYSDTFGLLGWTAISAGVVLLIAVPFVSRLIREMNTDEEIQKSSTLTPQVSLPPSS